MSIESFLTFWTAYNEVIIQGIIGVIATLLCIYVFFVAKDKTEQVIVEQNGGVSSDQLKALEASIAKILEQAPGHRGGGGGDISQDELEDLRGQLKQREDALSELRAQIESEAAQNKGDDNAAELLEKVQELEARLEEYEIIEDDIADLSLYKSENKKLKAELDALKAAKPQEVAAAPPSEADSETEPVQEFAEAIEQEAAAPAKDAASALIDEDVMAEFSAAVDEEFGALGGGGPAEASKEKEVAADGREVIDEIPSDEELDALLAEAAAEEAVGRKSSQSGAVNSELSSSSEPMASQPEPAATEVEEMPVEVAAVKERTEPDPQSAIDDLFAAESAASPAAEPAAVDSASDESAEESDVDVTDDPQAAIDAMLAGESAGSEAEPPAQESLTSVDESVEEVMAAEEEVSIEPEDPQAAIDAMLGGGEADEPQEASEEPAASNDQEVVASETSADDDEEAEVDTAQMMAEMEQLTQAAENDDGKDALEVETDIEKMAEEASKL